MVIVRNPGQRQNINSPRNVGLHDGAWLDLDLGPRSASRCVVLG